MTLRIIILGRKLYLLDEFMTTFSLENTPLPGLMIVKTICHEDKRGFYMDVWNQKEFQASGIAVNFVLEGQSRSREGVLRGLHYQNTVHQAKLVRVASGEIFDVAVDIRKDSPYYGKYFSIVLSYKNAKMMFIPPGFAHGFYTLSKVADVHYKYSEYYKNEYQAGIIWNDPDIGIPWPIRPDQEFIISERDAKFPRLRECKSAFHHIQPKSGGNAQC
jgi:dTDP-4-dehydrorhamnose 3,5-epimerase